MTFPGKDISICSGLVQHGKGLLPFPCQEQSCFTFFVLLWRFFHIFEISVPRRFFEFFHSCSVKKVSFCSIRSSTCLSMILLILPISIPRISRLHFPHIFPSFCILLNYYAFNYILYYILYNKICIYNPHIHISLCRWRKIEEI